MRDCNIKIKRTRGSDTEVTCDFVFRCEASLWESPQATIGLQRPAKSNAEGHCCTALFVFCGSDLTYVTAPFVVISREIKGAL